MEQEDPADNVLHVTPCEDKFDSISKEDRKEYQQMQTLGEHCARWMLLIEKKLPQLLQASGRCRKDIGALRRSPLSPTKISHDVKNVGYHDQMRQMKQGSDGGGGAMPPRHQKKR